jgi:uridine kinase
MDHPERDTHSGNRRLAALIGRILGARRHVPAQRALLVGLSGIDGSGKGHTTACLDEQLRGVGQNVAVICADDWLNLPEACINRDNPAEHFYKHAIRLDEMFAQLILPLIRNRSIDLVTQCGDAKATVHRERRYLFSDIDIVLLEGIFIFKQTYRDRFDLKIWVDCSFQTALCRAIARGQEGLPPAQTRDAFENIYFPAQRLHLRRDNPDDVADIVFKNDDVRTKR